VSEPADLARAFDQGDRAVIAALASGVAAVLPTATPDMVEIIRVAFDGRLLSQAVEVEAGASSVDVRVSFEATMPATSALAVDFSAHDFMQAGDGLETSLALELATGARNFTVFGVSDMEASLEYVPTAGTSTLTHSAGSYNKMLAVVMSICVAVFCLCAFTLRQSRSRLRKRSGVNRGISDPDVVPSVTTDPGPAQLTSVALPDGRVDQCPPQPPLSSRTEPLSVRQLQLSPEEEDGGNAIGGFSGGVQSFGCCKMASPGAQSQPCSAQEVRMPPAMASAWEHSTWRLKLGEMATFEGVWETPWNERRPATGANSCNLLEVSYRYR
jgi:hypothetical protein